MPGTKVLGLDRRTTDERVFTGTSDTDGTKVRIRLHRAPYPTGPQLAARRHGQAVAEELSGLDGVVTQRGVEVGFDVAAVSPAPDLDELDRWMAGVPSPTVHDRVRVAVNIADALAQIHGRGITHNALAPACMAVDDDLGVRIGGFEHATTLRSVASAAAGTSAALPYISPEQTGRMNRPVDARSDLYALGTILHELFAGHPPFHDDNPSALVHAHVARPAPRLDDQVPPGLADLVENLLRKDPDDRYQTASGATHDLDLIQTGLAEGRPVTLRSRDISEQLRLHERLYGRERETGALADALDRAHGGETTVVFVAGYSGIGKSSLVRELEPMVAKRFGWFTEGKFDLYQRDTPYAGWVGAIESTVRHILTLPSDELALLRAEIHERLGDGAAALADLCPALEGVVGPQPAPTPATPLESRTRLAAAVASLLAAVATTERPLVLFLDDLQWADLSSLRLLVSLLTDHREVSLLIAGAWRDSEITDDHPVRAMLLDLEEARVEVDSLRLQPLERGHVQSIVNDALATDSVAALELGELVHHKTGGNPFFIRQFLQAMHRDGILVFDHDALVWRWDPDEVATRAITDNVAELLEGRLGSLSPATLDCLQAASVIGGRFSMSSVVKVLGQEPPVTARALEEALAEQLITPLDAGYRYVLAATDHPEDTTEGPALDARYEFLHDRVRQATHDSLEDRDRAELHLQQARLLMADGGTEADTVIELAFHLCEAADLLTFAEERRAAVVSLTLAARRAKSTMALDAATRFLDVAETLLPADAWTADHGLALQVHTESADVAYIDGRYDDVAVLAAAVLDRTTEPLDRVPVHNILIGVGVGSADYARATQYALDVLSEDFGIELPRHPTTAHVAVELARCRAALGRRDPAELLSLPPMRDPERRAVMGILMKTATNAYWAEPNLVPVIAARMIRMSLDTGNDSLTAYGYALYAMVTSGVLGAEKTGYTYGRLSMDLLEVRPSTALLGRTALLWHGFVRHSRDPMRDCASDLFETYHAAFAAGDVENACYCAGVGFIALVLSGGPLSELVERHGGYVESVMRSGQEQTRTALAAWMQAVELLREPRTRSSALVGERFDWTARRGALLAAGHGTALPTESAAAGLYAFLMDDLTEAERNFGIMWEHRVGAPGQIYLGPCFALYAVTILRRRAAGPGSPKDRVRLRWLTHQVRVRARHNPQDMGPFLHLVEAEAARSRGDRALAIGHYLDVAAEARAGGVLHLEALALDEAGALEAAAGHPDQAAHLVGMASEVWRRLDVPFRVSARLGGASPTAGEGDGGAELGALDLRTLLETVRMISSEVTVADLVERVLSLTIRDAGAMQGLLLLVDDGVTEPLAEGYADPDGTIRVQVGEAAGGAEYIAAVVDYVIRTRSTVLIEDASRNELTRFDPRMSTLAKGSILCAPLVQSGRLIGVVYLANPGSTRVFNARRLSVVETICGQAAVTLHNARLFEEQRTQAESFSRFVPRPFLEQLDRSRVRDVALGDAVATDLTVLFSDLRGFTGISEGLSAARIFRLLNAYLGRMEPAISAHGGFIDKYVGDAVMSLFIGGSDSAVEAAVEMHRALDAFNAEQPEFPPLRMGVGIHAGPAMLGTVGSADRLETTVIGDTVNTASRLEGASKQFCDAVLISGQVTDQLANPGPFLLREVGRIIVKGKSEVLEVHEVLSARPADVAEAAAATRDRFAEALDAWYRADFVSAAALFRACSEAAPDDELPRRYAQRCDGFAADPPKGAWNGVEALESK